MPGPTLHIPAPGGRRRFASRRVDDYKWRVRVNDAEIGVLSRAIVTALLKQGFVRPKIEEKPLVQRITKLIVDNLLAEEALEQEAERLAERHSRQMLGMDRHKVVQGIKARLAKERGFTL